MYTELALAVLGSAALGAAQVSQVQGPAPPPVLLTTTKSGVLPVLPTPFSGIQTEEGALLDQGPVNGSFVGLNGPAVAQTSMPAMTYRATLPATMFNPYAGGNITGTVTAVGSAQGVQFTINLSGLPPANYGPFGYHIHGLPVPADGNCTSTLGHLDPQNRGEYFLCDPAQPQNCQIGDLAGKHGKIPPAATFTASYVEKYLSTDPSSPYFFGGVSIVFHTSNTTRLTCANFVMSSGGSGNGTTSSSSGAGGGCPVTSTMGTGTTTMAPTGAVTTTSQGTGTGTRPTTTPSTVPANGASKMLAGSAGGLLAGFVLALFL